MNLLRCLLAFMMLPTGFASAQQAVNQLPDGRTLAGSVPGTAGAPATSVFSVQGESGMVPLLATIGNWPSSWPITAVSLPLPTNAAQESGGNLAAAKTDLDTITALAAGTSGTLTQVAVIIGTASTAVLAASTAATFIKIKPPSTGSCGIWVRWDGAPATTAPPSEYVAPGEVVAWFKATQFLPITSVAAIASTSCTITLEYN